jgi:hypothetical protein
LLAALAAGALGCVFTALAVTVPQPELQVHLDGDFLRIAAPHLNFLSGKALERLKDGASVAFVAQLTISNSTSSVVPDARAVARFALSYDIWEEKFAVVKIGDRPESRRNSASHLSIRATENWCLDNLTIDRSSIPSDRPFFVQLDLRTEDPRDQLGIVGDPGISISRLIEVFSRQPRGNDHWSLQNGPYRLADLRKVGRG